MVDLPSPNLPPLPLVLPSGPDSNFSHADFRQYWCLDPAVIFLNHGSFGACPLPVLAAQQQLRSQIERQPLQFFNHDYEPLLDQARLRLGQFVGANPDDLAFLPNATTGVNTVLRSLRFKPGDELLTTNQEYNACRNVLDAIAQQWGLQLNVAVVPFPLEAAEQVVAAIAQAITPNTRLALIDHVVSQTGLVFPLAEIIDLLRSQGIETLIDGAHAPGMVPLDLQALGPTYYTGNCHKWLCAPKGAAFLYVTPERQADLRPLVMSHGANSPRRDRSRFRLEFDWMGTADPTAYLAVPTALDFVGHLLPGGWPALMQHNRQLALTARQTLAEALGQPLPCPEQMVGSLASLPLPDGDWQPLQAALLKTAQIEVPIIPWPTPSQRLVRISAQLYNTPEQYQQLAIALTQCLAQGL